VIVVDISLYIALVLEEGKPLTLDSRQREVAKPWESHLYQYGIARSDVNSHWGFRSLYRC